MKLQFVVAVILLCLLVVVVAGCATDPYSVCRRQAVERNNQGKVYGGGILAVLLVRAIDGPPPAHPPLADMLSACEPLK